MNIPRKHHFVPQVHIRKFETSDGYHLYFKSDKKFINKKSTIDIFSTKDLNTIANLAGELDHFTLENEFAELWDSKFTIFFKEINEVIDTHLKTKREPEFSQECLKFFFEYGIIGRMRRLKMEPNFGNGLTDLSEGLWEFGNIDADAQYLSEFSPDVIKNSKSLLENLTNQINQIIDSQSNLKYKGIMPTTAEILMPEECSCKIYFADVPSFVLPDSTAIIVASESQKDHFGYKYHPVSCVGIALSPQIFLEIKNNDITTDNSNSIQSVTNTQINTINTKAFQSSFTQIVTADKELILSLH